MYCSGALALSTSASGYVLPHGVPLLKSCTLPRPAAAASAVASAFEWLLLDAHLLLGGSLLDAEPLAADHGAVHRLQCTRSALAIAVPLPEYLLLPTTHCSLLSYSLATHSHTCIAVSASSAVEKETNPKPLLTWLRLGLGLGYKP